MEHELVETKLADERDEEKSNRIHVDHLSGLKPNVKREKKKSYAFKS